MVLLGHVVSVVLAHYEALRVFPGRGWALLSQLPLMILMITYTMLGLWILTLRCVDDHDSGAPAPVVMTCGLPPNTSLDLDAAGGREGVVAQCA